jgi:hypothetical protein
MPEANKHIINEPQPDYEKAEMDLLRDGLKRSHEERFLFLNQLIKTQKALQGAKVIVNSGQGLDHTSIDYNDIEPIQLLKQLQKNKVKYILAGDFAMCFYGHDLGTGVLDIWVDDSPENLLLLKEVLCDHKINGVAKLEGFQFFPDCRSFCLHNSMRLKSSTI